MNTDCPNRNSVRQGHTKSTECSNRYSPPRNGECDDATIPNLKSTEYSNRYSPPRNGGCDDANPNLKSTECSNRYSPPRNGGGVGVTTPNQQPVGLQQGTGLTQIVAALQAAFAGGVPLTQGVATGLYLFQPVGLCYQI